MPKMNAVPKSDKNGIHGTHNDKDTVTLNIVDSRSESQNSVPSAANAIGQYKSIPHLKGFFILITNDFSAPVEVRFEQGIYFYKTWDGQRGYDLVAGQSLIGPINDIYDLSAYKIKEEEISPVPTLTDDSVQEALEEELNQAYLTISQLEKSEKLLKNQIDNNPLKERFTKAKQEIDSLQNKLTLTSQRASVAEDELEQALVKVSDLEQMASKAEIGSELSPEFKNGITRVKMLLLQAKISSQTTEGMALIQEIIDSLEL